MKFLFLASILFSACILSCRTTSEGEARRFELKGHVISVDKNHRQVIVAHEEVKGLMAAMTMPFSIKDSSVFEVVAEGDQLQATLVLADKSSWLEDVVISKVSAVDNRSTAFREPKAGDQAPDFSLVNQDGEPITLQKFRGKALLLTFIYTRCPLPDYCILMSDNFAEVDDKLKNDTTLYGRTSLLSVSIDPEHDTTEVLRSYGAAYTGKTGPETFEHWEFATGKPEEIREIAGFFGLSYQSENDQIIHSLRTALISPGGKIYKLYRGNEWRSDEILRDLQTLFDIN